MPCSYSAGHLCVTEIPLFAGELILQLLYPSVVSSTSVSCLMLSGWDAMSSAFPLSPLPHSPQLPQWLSPWACSTQTPSYLLIWCSYWLCLLLALEKGLLHLRSFEATNSFVLPTWEEREQGEPGALPEAGEGRGAVVFKCRQGDVRKPLQVPWLQYGKGDSNMAGPYDTLLCCVAVQWLLLPSHNCIWMKE